MKSAIKCPNCGQLTRYSETYSMKITVYTNSLGLSEFNILKVRVCKKCAKKAGYKVAKKFPVIKKVTISGIDHVTGKRVTEELSIDTGKKTTVGKPRMAGLNIPKGVHIKASQGRGAEGYGSHGLDGQDVGGGPGRGLYEGEKREE